MDDFELVERRIDSVGQLAKLTEKQLVAFLLHHMGYTQDEIGQMAGVTQGAISKRIERARIRLNNDFGLNME